MAELPECKPTAYFSYFIGLHFWFKFKPLKVSLFWYCLLIGCWLRETLLYLTCVIDCKRLISMLISVPWSFLLWYFLVPTLPSFVWVHFLHPFTILVVHHDHIELLISLIIQVFYVLFSTRFCFFVNNNCTFFYLPKNVCWNYLKCKYWLIFEMSRWRLVKRRKTFCLNHEERCIVLYPESGKKRVWELWRFLSTEAQTRQGFWWGETKYVLQFLVVVTCSII